MWRKQGSMLGVALVDFSRNNCQYIASGIAYWTLFSLFPLALAGIAVLGYIYDSPEEQERVVTGIIELIPVAEAQLSELVGEIHRARDALGVIAIVGLLWTGSAMFSAVRKGINHAWHVRKPPYFLLERAIDLTMLLGVAALAFVHVLFTTNLLGVSALSASVSETAAWIPIRVFFEVLAFALTTGPFILLYRFVPHTGVKWGDTLLGAVMGATIFHTVRVGFSIFMSNFAALNVVYGSLRAIMAVLMWAYLSSMAIMWGAQVAYTYSGVFGSRAGTIALPEPKPKSESRPLTQRIVGTAVTLASWLLPPGMLRR